MEIIGTVKNYEWGKLGSNSIVAELASLNDEDFKINENEPYSELWIGTHPNGPARVKGSGEQLQHTLPFLLKVLSIRKALSIQVHPNKNKAQKLHKERPDIYKDPNHKPELAIAITPFLALCGFRKNREIYQFCKDLPPLSKLLGVENVETLNEESAHSLRQCFHKLMSSESDETSACIERILNNHSEILANHKMLDVFRNINHDFPQDVGVLALFFLNLIHLQPGQAIFLGANEIHAYISGDCVECMACSDNVIRAGLTPKYKDLEELISCLNYEGQLPSEKLLYPHRIDAHTEVFGPPIDDFAVMRVNLPSSMMSYQLQLPVNQYGSFLLVVQGERRLLIEDQADVMLKRGSIVYIPPETSSNILFLLEDLKVDFLAYISMINCFREESSIQAIEEKIV